MPPRFTRNEFVLTESILALDTLIQKSYLIPLEFLLEFVSWLFNVNAMLIFFIIVTIVIIIAATSKKKPKNTFLPPKPVAFKSSVASTFRNKPVKQKRPVAAVAVNPNALELSTKHFGWEWMQFLKARQENLKVSNQEIYRVMAIGYSKMSVKALENLLVSFVQIKPAMDGSVSVLATADDYVDLHQSTYDLIKANRFSQDNVQTMLSLLAERGRIATLRKKEEQKMAQIKVSAPAAIVEQTRVDNSNAGSPLPIPIQKEQVPPKINDTSTNNKVHVNQDESIIEVGNLVQRIEFSEPLQSTPATLQPAYSGYDPDEYSLGKKYKKKLNLSPQEAGWLNKFYNYNNIFNAIEGCEVEIIKLYLLSLKLIVKRFKKENTSLSQEIQSLKAKLAEFERSSSHYWEGYGESGLGNSAESDAYYFIYKKAEMVIRETWGHRRKISADFYSRSEEVKALFYARLGPIIEEVIEHLRPTIGVPDEETELALNAASTTRWKDKFQELTRTGAENDKSALISSLYELGRLNQKNPAVENIYYEASRFMAAVDRMESLKLYLHYVWQDLHSVIVDNKQLNKTIQKKLFHNQDQLLTFTGIIDELCTTRDLKAALESVESIYKPRRKSIVLDNSVIAKVEQQHSGTVAILSEYLQDEEEVYEFKTSAVSPSVLEQAVLSSENVALQNESGFSAIQLGFLDRFAHSNELDLASAEEYSREHGVFKNQLIDGINELCYELLDDVLIEESADGYEINPDYFKQILSK